MLFGKKEKTSIKQDDILETKKILSALKLYKESKKKIDEQVRVNENWFQSKHWQYIKGNQQDLGHEPTTPFILNAVWNKHADAMDNYPEPVFLEREENDREEAEKLSKIVPLILEKNDFEKIYSDVWWQKIKQGTGIYYVGWDSSKDNGLGDITINKIDILRFFAQPHIDHLQDSRYIFVLSLVDTDILKKQYPDKEIASDAASSTIQSYFGDYKQEELEGKSCLIDCYEKCRTETGKEAVHLTKIVGETVLYSTKTDERFAQKGLYEHGLYPFVVDVFIPKESSIYGIGMIECAKPTQEYIDKLDYLIEANCLVSGKPRWIVKRSSGIRVDDLRDLNKDFIEADTAVDETAVRAFQATAIPSHIIQHRQNKINELKEVIGNRDFAQGSVTGGVTAAGAISALQEAGNKLSRDNIKSSYRAFKDIVNLCVELIREFYDEERSFRITGDNGEVEYGTISNQNIKPQPQMTVTGETVYRKAVFDIKIIPQRKNPFNTNTHNQMVMQLLQSGAFTAQAADSAIIALNAMIMENKDSIIRGLKDLKAKAQMEQMQMMQMQQQMAMQQASIPQEQSIPPDSENVGGGVAM